MTAKAGERFVCVCCRESHDVGDASYDEQYGGPVCDQCRVFSLCATAWLKKKGITRPISTADVSSDNFKRFQGYKI